MKSLCAIKKLKNVKLFWILLKRLIGALASLPASVKMRIKICRFGTFVLEYGADVVLGISKLFLLC